MILSFNHKGLEQLYLSGSTKGVNQEHVPKLLRVMKSLDYARSINDLNVPGFRTHRLKGSMTGYLSIWISGNWRVIFKFSGSNVELVDYTDYH